ncbi:MAG: ThuA domain-containing protein [Eubacteriales bacterium]|nr:ThuA domain-containing protein [Eubacteriales bacterium]
MAKKALIVKGGWAGHEPDQVTVIFDRELKSLGFDVEISTTLDSFLDKEKMKALDLIVPVWTMGEITKEQAAGAADAVREGTGMAGCHGGMCDAFRQNTTWQFVTGGQWVAHPGNNGIEYVVNIKPGSSPIIEGINDFKVVSEQYYLHIDPAINVLATTPFPVAPGPYDTNGHLDMPVAWTKFWGKGRVFYNSLGHHADVFDIEPALLIMKRGFAWAACMNDVGSVQL